MAAVFEIGKRYRSVEGFVMECTERTPSGQGVRFIRRQEPVTSPDGSVWQLKDKEVYGILDFLPSYDTETATFGYDDVVYADQVIQ